MHDGDESAPFADQRHTVEATARLIPELRARGLVFGTVCENEQATAINRDEPHTETIEDVKTDAAIEDRFEATDN
jgi:hypothetical protein